MLFTSQNALHITLGNEQWLILLLEVCKTKKRGDLSLSLHHAGLACVEILVDHMIHVVLHLLPQYVQLLLSRVPTQWSSQSIGSQHTNKSFRQCYGSGGFLIRGSGNLFDPGSGMEKIRIRDKQPGSATVVSDPELLHLLRKQAFCWKRNEKSKLNHRDISIRTEVLLPNLNMQADN